MKISAEPILVSLFKEYMKGILTSSLSAETAPLNNAVEEVNTHSSIDLKPTNIAHDCTDWALYDKYIFPAGDHRIVTNESGQICGELWTFADGHAIDNCVAICKGPKHAWPFCSRQRSWEVSAEKPPQMLERVLARWLVEGASHVSTAKHMAFHLY